MDRKECEDDELFVLLYPSLRRFAAVVGSRHHDPDDLVQEALARTLATGPLTEIDNPAAYLRRAVSNLAINRGRAEATHRRHMALSLTDVAISDHYPSDLDELRRLSPIDRAVIYLVDVEGRPFAETAAMLGITAAAARLRASRARRRLREILEENNEHNRPT